LWKEGYEVVSNERTNQFLNLTESELREALVENAYRKDDDSRRWFSRFGFAHDSVNGNPAEGLRQGLELLNKCKELDEDAYIEIYKGGAYYWLGIASFMVYEYELATFFFDAAVSEEIRWGDDPRTTDPPPAMLFMRMDGEHPKQAAGPLVKAAQKGIERWIAHYNALTDSPTNGMSMQSLRERLFIPSIIPDHEKWRSLTSTFITFCLEWDYRNMLFDLRLMPGTLEPFYIHLFKGCLLFESLLKVNPKKQPPPEQNTLGKVLVYLHKELEIDHDIGNHMGGKQLAEVLSELDNSQDSIELSVLFSGMVRNTLGHNLGWDVGLTKIQYQRLFQMIAASCIHVVAKLY
jgi:hypothetical protein